MAEPGSPNDQETSTSQTPVGSLVREFLREAAISTGNAVTIIKQKLQYVAKQHRVIDDFKHDEEIYHSIQILKHISKQSKAITRIYKLWHQREKEYSVAETRHASRLKRLAQEFEPLQMEALLLSYAEGLGKLAEYHCEYLTTIANEFVRPVEGFYRTNVKQTHAKKIECNMAAMLRENSIKTYEAKVEAENRKEPEKRDRGAIRIAEENKEDAENQYNLISGELLMLVDSLELKQRMELPSQLLAYLCAQEAYYQNCHQTVVQLREKLTPLAKELQAEDFQPNYRPLDAPKPVNNNHRTDFDDGGNSPRGVESDDDDDNDDHDAYRYKSAPTTPNMGNNSAPPLPPKATQTAPPLPEKNNANLPPLPKKTTIRSAHDSDSD